MPTTTTAHDDARPETARATLDTNGAADDPQPEDPETPEQAKLNIDRTVFFSDAVIAIAITLLALKIEISGLSGDTTNRELLGDLNEALPRIITFIWSFALVAVYWSLHRRMFGKITRLDTTMTTLNIVFLALVALLPFPADILGQIATAVSVSLYGLNVAAISLVMAAMWHHAYSHHRLVETRMTGHHIRAATFQYLFSAGVALLTVAFSWVNPTLGLCVWFVLMFQPLIRRLSERLARWETVRRPGTERLSP